MTSLVGIWLSSFKLNFVWFQWINTFEKRYHHTAPISSIYALREALSIVSQEGLEKCWERHLSCRNRLIEGLEKQGLKPFAEEHARLTCVTTVAVPEGLDWKAVTSYAMMKWVVGQYSETFPILLNFICYHKAQCWNCWRLRTKCWSRLAYWVDGAECNLRKSWSSSRSSGRSYWAC